MNKLNRIFLAIAAIFIGTMLFSTVEAVTVELVSPADGSSTDDSIPDFSFDITDFTDNVTCDLMINGSNYGSEDVTADGSYSITASTALDEGTNSWNIDCDGDTASQDWEVIIDTTAPTVSLSDPDDDEIFSSENRRPDFTFTPDDNLATTLDCDLYIDSVTQGGWSATVNAGDSETISLSADVEWGKHRWHIECTDDAGNLGTSATRDFYMGGLEITDIDLSEDKVKPGEEIDIDVDVKNLMSDLDMNNVDVTIENDDLDIDEDDEIDEIKDGDKETITFKVKIDPEADEGTYDIEVSVKGEDDDDYEHEAFDTVEIEVEREKHELIFESASFSPSTVECAKTTEITIEVQNIGRSDEDDVYFIVKNKELNIEELSDEFDIDRDDDKKESLDIIIPEDVEGKIYTFIIEVWYDDEDEKAVYSAKLEVDCFQPKHAIELSVDTTGLDLRPGEEGEIEATLENTGDLEATYEISLTGVSTWADYSVTPSEATLNPDETAVITVHIIPNRDASEGVKSATLSIKRNGNTVASKALKINVEKTDIDVEIISEGEEGERPTITGASVLDTIGENNLAVIVAIVIAVVIIAISLGYKRIPRKK
ncbi:MAG: putative S-layer protein [Candidatus Woesearchaeota archaeon]|nr:MAG: putative S-layer protein [Candidatus Woesearchaeota archaeon]